MLLTTSRPQRREIENKLKKKIQQLETTNSGSGIYQGGSSGKWWGGSRGKTTLPGRIGQA